MNKAEQRAAAKDLFMLGWDQGRIAATVQVTEATISNWVNKGDNGASWKEQRAKKFRLEDSISTDVLELIDYQIRALRSRYLEFENTDANGQLPLISKGDIDALSKMFAAVKQKDVSWTHYVNVCRELAEYVATKDPEFAKALTEFTDAFLMNKREQIM